MINCKICKTSVPKYQIFCSSCGARADSEVKSETLHRRGVIARLKDFYWGLFLSVTDKAFDDASLLAAQYGDIEPLDGAGGQGAGAQGGDEDSAGGTEKGSHWKNVW